MRMAMDRLRREEHRRQFEEDARNAEERDRQQQAEEEARANAAYDLKRLWVEASTEGLDRELAMLELERDRALKQAFEEGVPEEYVNAAFEIRRAMAEAAAEAEQPKMEAVGMFSPARLAGLDMAFPVQERTARATEAISENTRRTVEELMRQREYNVFE